MRRIRSILILALSGGLLHLAVGCGPAEPIGKTNDRTGSAMLPAELKGVGATFVQPIMKDWTEKYLQETNDLVRVNYDAKGSGAGISAMTTQESEFGCSDAPMKKAEVEAAAAKGGTVLHIPVVVGAVVPVYTLNAIDKSKPLTFSGPVLAEIFTGKITNWNDEKLKALNPGIALPNLGIKPVYRADKSGTSFIFSSYLGKVSPEFRKAIPASTEPAWPKEVGSREQQTKGMADAVARADGAIGYVELTYALDNKIAFGAVTNQAGKPVLATLSAITSAAASSMATKATIEPYSLHELTYDLTDAAGADSYPISAMSFAILYGKQSGAKGKATVEFIRWIATSEKGQKMAGIRNYAPLPAELRKRVNELLDTVEFRN
jgi:phosphate transport system substrate-binding protein